VSTDSLKLDGATGAARAAATLLEIVRAETRERHLRIEAAVDLLGDRCTRDRFVRFLRATCAVVQPLEPQLKAALGKEFVSADLGTRTDRLLRDLSLLDGNTSVDPAPCLPRIASVPSAFGTTYVLEGSLLGGAVIARAVHARLGLPEMMTTYFSAAGEETGRRWGRFVTALNAFGAHASESERASVVRAAVETFEAYHAAVRREGLTT
jgi:heme oxygenase (biliverdin-IX-beta and delta-forming)